MTAVEIPSKRRKLYEFIFKIISLKKADEEKFEINIENLNEFKLLTANLLKYFNATANNLIKSLDKINNKFNITKNIDNLEFFKEIKSKVTDDTLLISSNLRANILDVLEKDFDVIIQKDELKEKSSNDLFTNIPNQINDILNKVKAKIDKGIEEQKKSKTKDEKNLNEIIILFNKLDEIKEFSEALPLLKEFTTRFYSKNSSYTYSQLKKSFNNKKIDNTRANIILNEQLKPNFIEAIILFILTNFGNLSIKSIFEKTKINSRKIFASLLSLIEKGLVIEESESEGDPIYSNYLLGNQIKKYLENTKDRLNNIKTKSNKEIINSVNKNIKQLDSLIELATNLIKIDIKSYEEEFQSLEKFVIDLESLIPKQDKINEDLKFKVDSMIEAYKMYRLPLVVEKDEKLQELLDDEAKLSQTFETLLQQDYLKGKIIWAIKKFGPLNIKQLEEKTNILKSKLFILLNILRMNDEISIKDAHTEYQVFDIPRKPSKFEKFIGGFLENFLGIIQDMNSIKEKSKKLDENLFEINDLINKIKGFFLEIKNLSFNKEVLFLDELTEVFKRINEFNEKFLSLRSKITLGEKELDFSKLVPIKITKVDENY